MVHVETVILMLLRTIGCGRADVMSLPRPIPVLVLPWESAERVLNYVSASKSQGLW